MWLCSCPNFTFERGGKDLNLIVAPARLVFTDIFMANGILSDDESPVSTKKMYTGCCFPS